MINDHFPTAFTVLAILGALYAPVKAVESHIPERPAVATPGITAEADAVLGAKLLVCNTCHGASGVPGSTPTPIIWGLQENYLLKQLHDFQRGDRKSEVMEWMATALTVDELGPAAAFFSKKNWPARPTRAAAGSPPPGAAVCQICHQQNFVGGLPAPRLAGPTYDYLVEGVRKYSERGGAKQPRQNGIIKGNAPPRRGG